MTNKNRRGLTAVFLAALLSAATAAEAGWVAYQSLKCLPRIEAAWVASVTP